MSPVYPLNRLRDRIRTTSRWKWAILLGVLCCLSLGFGLSVSHNKARAQVFGEPPQVPAQPPQAPGFGELPLKINFASVAYFFFDDKRNVYMVFPGVPPFYITGAEIEAVNRYVNAKPPEVPYLPQKIGRYYINPGHVAYERKNDAGGMKLQLLGCQGPIDLLPKEAEEWAAWWSRNMQREAPAPAPSPSPGPGPAPTPVAPPAVRPG